MSFIRKLPPTFVRFCAVLSFLLLAACQDTPPLVQQESYVFGTRVEILVADTRREKAGAAIAQVLREFDRLNRTYHAWQPSELTDLNVALAAGKPAEITPEMRDFLREAQELAVRSAHRFDPGIGQLVRLWGFQNDEFSARLPDPDALAAWRKHPASIAELHISDRQAWSDNPHLALDFGGYLKGVALDRAARFLRAQGIENALINIGGNIMALGDKYGKPWKVGIQHPREPGPLAILELRDGEAIGTSGDYQRYFELDGRRYSHLLDPATGEPAQHTQAVTVLIPPGEKAGTFSDALSKPPFIADAAHWQQTARTLGLSHILRIDAQGQIEVSPELNDRLTFVGKKPPVTVTPSLLPKHVR